MLWCRAGFRAEKPGQFSRILSVWGQQARLDSNGNYPASAWGNHASNAVISTLQVSCELQISISTVVSDDVQMFNPWFTQLQGQKHHQQPQVLLAKLSFSWYTLFYPEEDNFILSTQSTTLLIKHSWNALLVNITILLTWQSIPTVDLY